MLFIVCDSVIHVSIWGTFGMVYLIKSVVSDICIRIWCTSIIIWCLMCNILLLLTFMKVNRTY